MATIPPVNIASPAFKADPYPYYALLRAEAPVHRVTLPDKQDAWLVTRYDDVAALLKDDRFSKDPQKALTPDQKKRQPWIPGVFRPLLKNMLDVDPPDHTRLRGLVHQAFTPRLVEAMRGRIQALTDALLDDAARRGTMDLIRDFALPLPTTVIAEILGVPAADRHKFRRWTNAFVTASTSPWAKLRSIPHAMAFVRYLRRLIAARRDRPRDDLVSALVIAEEAGDQLTGDELLSMLFLLLVAGHETTVNLIGNGTLALLGHPDQWERLRSEPTLIRSAVEELLRYDSPVESATERYALEGVTIAGATIPRGGLSFAVIASANRDDRQFDRPDDLDLAREPNRHLSFGQGVHYCLGAPLARLEGQIALATLARRLPDLRLAVPKASLRWRPGLVLRGMTSLPVAFSPRKAGSTSADRDVDLIHVDGQ
ncbi:MAG TPA: cytochrome P450 [Isosphaeraceae bacterium]|jgi:cytochrome P450 PksS|nr:cytochrome P450 [Isosphaeraceae bacterium]